MDAFSCKKDSSLLWRQRWCPTVGEVSCFPFSFELTHSLQNPWDLGSPVGLFHHSLTSPLVQLFFLQSSSTFKCRNQPKNRRSSASLSNGAHFTGNLASKTKQARAVSLVGRVKGSRYNLTRRSNYRMQGHFGPPVLHVSRSFQERSITQQGPL